MVIAGGTGARYELLRTFDSPKKLNSYTPKIETKLTTIQKTHGMRGPMAQLLANHNGHN